MMIWLGFRNVCPVLEIHGPIMLVLWIKIRIETIALNQSRVNRAASSPTGKAGA
jgi:hypothetical protein